MEDATGTPRFAVQSRTTLYDGRFQVVRRRVVCSDGTTVDRDAVVHPGAVAIVAVDDRDRFVLVRQYRAAVDRTVLEVPAGTLEHGEDPAACAERELWEETGLIARRIEPLAHFVIAPGWCDEIVHCFVATDLQQGERRPQSPEEQSMTIEAVPRSAALQMIDAGELDDAKSLLGILLYERTCRGGDLS